MNTHPEYLLPPLYLPGNFKSRRTPRWEVFLSVVNNIGMQKKGTIEG